MRQSDSVGGPIRCGAFSETAESGEKLIGDSKHIAERALAYDPCDGNGRILNEGGAA